MKIKKNLYLLFKRLFDIIFSVFLIILLSFLMIIIIILILIIDKHNPIYFSKRVGKNNILFLMPKFRTMQVNTPQVATHLFKNQKNISRFGKILRKTSLDEIPQLFTIFFGYMSFVGPRPALYNQYDLIRLRQDRNIHLLIPGLTGIAQINGRDNNSLETKVLYDEEYLNNISLINDFKIILKTFLILMKSKNIKH